ncbi:hypothetical protein NJB1907f44_05550 [Mycobacterium marinum]|nr:hypothetical protein NJB1907f34b_09730 [Mycobacterium marinum]GJN99049.1 hypothetical protein NJB1907E8_50170 [Mycobacterium marinum]GJO12404.1 hypothetical protein NJB1808e29_50530 [Mycobacterium marinum]GJO15404.1 hypothetical protein NJB1907E90_42110 [Mycobacterium marinum]GJO22231.1 hypothetical protein NJB1728e18_24640 [Mycobacterium marinum]
MLSERGSAKADDNGSAQAAGETISPGLINNGALNDAAPTGRAPLGTTAPPIVNT